MKFFYKLLAVLTLISVFVGGLTGCDALDGLLSSFDSSDSTVTDQNGSTDSDNGEEEKDYSEDPYLNMSKEEFYADYEPAECYMDSYYRSCHSFMSGSIAPQDQYQTLAEHRPVQNGKYLRNTSSLYTEDKNGYHIVDSEGNIVNTVYRGGGYVTLEEVAAYVYAFGDVPANYTASKKTKPYASSWGIYLRVNHTKFSGSTSKYPYEPVLPRISGCGGDLQYYELDIGTTGTTCDPSYDARVYNDGSKITRGAARIVYARFYYKNGLEISSTDDKYVFYTNNHYNDFSEYLNYEGGWGEIFGNITGGGAISSKVDYNPTPYVKTERADFTVDTAHIFVFFIEVKEYC